MKYPIYIITLILSCGILCIQPNLSKADGLVFSENITFLQPDGKSYLVYRGIRSNKNSYRLMFNTRLSLDSFYYIYPNQYIWDANSDENGNTLKFDTGNHVIVYQDRFAKELSIDSNNVFTYKSSDGIIDKHERYGFWNAPDNFSTFIYVWIVPDNFEILSYQSNQNGEWIRREKSITFISENSNNLTFEISYRKLDTDNNLGTSSNDQYTKAIVNDKLEKKSKPDEPIKVSGSFDMPVVLEGVYFQAGSSSLMIDSFQNLNYIVSILKQYPELKIEIGGHTDSLGDAQFNLKLSQLRAESVLSYLISKGVSSNQLEAKGYGETQPIDDNSTKNGRRKNRRVEIQKIQDLQE